MKHFITSRLRQLLAVAVIAVTTAVSSQNNSYQRFPDPEIKLEADKRIEMLRQRHPERFAAMDEMQLRHLHEIEYRKIESWQELHNHPAYKPPKNVSDNSLVSQTDSLALVALYNATNGPNLTNKTNWISSSNTCAVGNNLNANNATNFTGLPGGYRTNDGFFYDFGYYGIWWSSTETSSDYAWSRHLYYSFGYVGVYYYYKRGGFSVRCLRD